MTPTPEPTPAVEALRRAWANRRDLGEYAGVPFEGLLAAHDAQVAEKAWVAGALWALADQGNDITVWLIEAVERRAREENAHA